MQNSATSRASATAKNDRSISDGNGVESSLHGRPVGESGTENRADEKPPRDPQREAAAKVEISRDEAVKLLEEIGKDFVKLRANGRAGAWAGLEDKLMLNAHVFISAGLMSPKDLIGMATEIEGFRKSETGSQQAPGDFLAEWLSAEDKPKTPKKKLGRPPKAKAA